MLLVGVAIGLAVAAASTRALRSLLFGVEALDPATFGVVACGMVLVGLLAAYLPARCLTAGYLHYWSARWSSNVVVSPAWVISELGDPATSNDSFNYVAVNLLYWLIDRRAWLGGEYLYGRRELRNGLHGSDSRIQLATCFNI